MAEDEPEFNTEPQNPAQLRRGGLRFLRVQDLGNTSSSAKTQRVANAPAHEKAVQNVQAWRNPGRECPCGMGIVPRLYEAL